MSAVIDILAELVAIDSVNPEWGGPGEAGIARYLHACCEERGIETHDHEVLPGRANLYARIPGRDTSRAILFEAHMDTVAAGEMTIPPFDPVIRDGRLFGRGACDVKAGLAGMLHAIRTLAEEDELPACDVWLAAVIDEEHAYRGVLGAIDWFQARGVAPEAAVVAEPTELRVVRANKGVLRFTIETMGVASHSAKPHLGRNAIVTMATVIARIEDHHAALSRRSHPLVGAATGSIGIIRGGTQVNVVPDQCEIAIDRRLLPGETGEAALAEYRVTLEEFSSDEVRIGSPSLCDEAMETPGDAEVVGVASRVLTALGEEPAPIGVPYGCDCTKLSRAGIPSIIFGPGSIDQAHGAREFVEVAQVEKATTFYRRFATEFTGVSSGEAPVR